MRCLLGEQASEKSLAKMADTCTEFIRSVGVDLVEHTELDEQVFECLNIADLATRFNICFPVPSKRPEDVLSVLEMVWMNWVSHLISDMGGEFEGELGEFMEAHGIRKYVLPSEAPWQNGLVEFTGGTWKAAARKAIKDVGARCFVEMRRLASMVNWARNARINSSGHSHALSIIRQGYKLSWSLQVANWRHWSDHHSEFGRRVSSARRAFETMDTNHPLRGALSAGVGAIAQTGRL